MADRAHKHNRPSGGRLENVSGALLVRRFSVRQPEMFRVIKEAFEEKLTSIDEAALCELAQTAMDIEYDGLEGDFLQAGCGSGGGAAIVIAHAKKRTRIFTVHDPFDSRLPAGRQDPSAEADLRNKLGEYKADERLNVRLLPGPYEKTIAAEGPLALAHLDCGKYEPMRILLERLAPRLVPGGQLILDDYKNKEECKRAADEYFQGKKGFEFVRKSRLHVIRN